MGTRLRRPFGACQRMAGSLIIYESFLFPGKMHNQLVAYGLQDLHQHQQQHHRDHHYISLETLVTEADRQVAQATGTDHTGHCLRAARHW